MWCLKKECGAFKLNQAIWGGVNGFVTTTHDIIQGQFPNALMLSSSYKQILDKNDFF